MQTGTDGVITAVAEEPPSKNVRVARRGVAAGLLALALYMTLATYAAMSGWVYNEAVSFARSTLILGMIAGLGVALYGYGVERSERKCVSANVELVEQFRNVLAEAEVDRVRRERRIVDRIIEAVAEEIAELDAQQARIVKELLELRAAAARTHLGLSERRLEAIVIRAWRKSYMTGFVDCMDGRTPTVPQVPPSLRLIKLPPSIDS